MPFFPVVFSDMLTVFVGIDFLKNQDILPLEERFPRSCSFWDLFCCIHKDEPQFQRPASLFSLTEAQAPFEFSFNPTLDEKHNSCVVFPHSVDTTRSDILRYSLILT